MLHIVARCEVVKQVFVNCEGLFGLLLVIFQEIESQVVSLKYNT